MILRYLVPVLLVCGPASAAEIRLCQSRPTVTPTLTCLYDGDSGWQNGTHWHLFGVDAPEIEAPGAGCRNEQVLGIRAVNALRSMMAAGYTVIYKGRKDEAGRELARITLADGRDAASELMSRGLAQALPNTGEKWCDR